MKPYKGKIRNWRLEPRGLHFVIIGEIEGDYIRTSIVHSINFIAAFAETQNSLYQLEGPPEGSKREEWRR